MASDGTIRMVSGLWRFPVKSMGGERLDAVELSDRGFVGDRAYALIDAETGRVVSAKSARRFPGILSCKASFVEPPQPDREAPPVRIALPGGPSVRSDDAGADRILSAHFGREVRLARSVPEDYTIDVYHPDVEGADSLGRRDTVVPLQLGPAIFAEMGMPSPVPAGAFFDAFPVSLISTSTLARLGELEPANRFDERRFRMNVMVSTGDGGFPENGWLGRQVSLGGAARLRLEVPDSRCVMTTLAQDDLPADLGILRALIRHNGLELEPGHRSPCAGVYAIVTAPGTVRTGDRVTVAG